MKLILDFMYYGEVDVNITDVASLIKAAELLDLTSLIHVYHCFPKEFSCKDISTKSMDNRCSVSCTNQIRHDTKNLLEEHVPHDPAILDTREERLRFKSQTIHVHSIGDSSAKYFNDFQGVSGKSHKDHSKSSVPNIFDSFKKNTKSDKENVNEELPPLTFVAVSEIEEPNERHQDDRMYFDSDLRDPLGEYSGIFDVSEERSVKKECTFQSELQVKDENDVPESMTEDVLISDKLTHSFHKLTSTKCKSFLSCDRESGKDRNPDVKLSDTFCSEGCASEKTRDLEIIFESTCEVSGADVKEEKVFETGECLSNIVGDNTETGVLEHQSELLNSGVQHLSSVNYQHDVKEEDCDASTSKNSTLFASKFGSRTPAILTSAYTETQRIEVRKKLKQKGKHSGDKPFQCEICKTSFTQKGNLKTHMGIHSGDKPFQCGICNFSFSVKSYLKRHLGIHSGDKPFQCDICNSKFRFKGHRVNHMRTHSGEKPFQCEICKTTFSERGSVKRHMRTHSGEKPFQCDICETSFSEKWSLRRHMRIHFVDQLFSVKSVNSHPTKGHFLPYV